MIRACGLLALDDPVGLLRDRDAVIIDEIQRAPDLMLAIKASVDADRRPGRFIVTGSANLLTLRTIQGFAGRTDRTAAADAAQPGRACRDRPGAFLDRLFAADSFVEGKARTATDFLLVLTLRLS